MATPKAMGEGFGEGAATDPEIPGGGDGGGVRGGGLCPPSRQRNFFKIQSQKVYCDAFQTVLSTVFKFQNYNIFQLKIL